MRETAKEGILKFDISDIDGELAFKRAVKVDDYCAALLDVANEVFRPHRKHGYSSKKLQDIINISYDDDKNLVLDMISLLEDMFYEIMEENDINLDKLY